MRNIHYILFMSLLIFSCTEKQKNQDASVILSEIDTTKVKAVQLPRPNSENYTYKDAENRKSDIYDMQLSAKYFDWENPTSGGALHITKNDEIEVYQSTMEMIYSKKRIDKSNDSTSYYNPFPKGSSVVIQKEYIKNI